MLLNTGVITEDQAWEYFALGFRRPGMQRKQGVRGDRAHSYREDVDSSLLQLEWVDVDGYPTDRGHKFMSIWSDTVGRTRPPASSTSAPLIQTGRYASFLHYIARLSERTFADDPLAYTRELSDGRPVFDEESYTEYPATSWTRWSTS